MSKIKTLKSELRRRAINGGGGHGTIEKRLCTIEMFCAWLEQENRQIRKIRNRDLRDFIADRKQCGFAIGTLQNLASHLRNVENSVSFSNQEIGAFGRCRAGTGCAISDPDYFRCLDRVENDGVRAAAQLQRFLGLRALEAIESGRSLSHWIWALERGQLLRVIHGTKGGKLRALEVPDPVGSLRVVSEAIEVSRKQGGQTVRGWNGSLKSAINRYFYYMRKAGFTGKLSPHSLRYAYAAEMVLFYRRQGMSVREALATVALCLGHGDGRGSYVRRVYLQGSEHVLDPDLDVEDNRAWRPTSCTTEYEGRIILSS